MSPASTTTRREEQGDEKKTKIRLYKDRASYSFQAAQKILQQQPLVHVAFVEDNGSDATVMNLPLLAVLVPLDNGLDDEEGHAVYLHTYSSSTLVNCVKKGLSTMTATCTLIDGLVLSPTAHDHSLNYRSATFHLGPDIDLVTDLEEKTRVLAAVTDTVVGYARCKQAVGVPERAAVDRTAVVRCSIAAISCKQRNGGFQGGQPPEMQEEIEGEGEPRAFKGVVPCWTQFGSPIGFGHDRAQVIDVFTERSAAGEESATNSAWASASIER